jgi:hypothetical protein
MKVARISSSTSASHHGGLEAYEADGRRELVRSRAAVHPRGRKRITTEESVEDSYILKLVHFLVA